MFNAEFNKEIPNLNSFVFLTLYLCRSLVITADV
jgi:hypothetical protein